MRASRYCLRLRENPDPTVALDDDEDEEEVDVDDDEDADDPCSPSVPVAAVPDILLPHNGS